MTVHLIESADMFKNNNLNQIKVQMMQIRRKSMKTYL